MTAVKIKRFCGLTNDTYLLNLPTVFFFPFVFQFEKQERRKHMSDGLGANLFRRVLIKIQQ